MVANPVITSTPVLFTEHYHLDSLRVGLTYLAIGVGMLIGSIGCMGKGPDRDWRISTERRHIQAGNRKPQGPSDLIDFSLEVARTQTTWYPLVTFRVCCAGYGWTIQYDGNLAVPLTFQVIIGVSTVSVMSSFKHYCLIYILVGLLVQLQAYVILVEHP
jgi:hypothetical protein